MSELVRAPERSVVFLTPDRQIDRRILLEADSLEAVGWKVTIIGMPLDEGMQDADSRVVRIGGQGAQTGARRENLVLGLYRWVRGILPMNGRLMRFLKKAAWVYVVDQESFYLKLFQDTVRRYRPTVFVAADLPMLPVACQAARESNARLVYDSHELYAEQEFSAREKRRWQEIEARHIGACDAVVTVNPSIARELEQRYGLDRVHVIYNAERLGEERLRERIFHQLYGLPDHSLILLLQGGIGAGRNIETLVDAMGRVKNPDVHLVVLGDGALVAQLKERARSLGVSGRVHFHGAVPQAQLGSYTVAADLGVIPYQATCLNNFYCTPNKLFEFIAAGLPVLASDLPEIRNFVAGFGIGLLGEMATPESAARLIDECFSDPERLGDWRNRAREARRQVCWEVEGAKFQEIFESLP